MMTLDIQPLPDEHLVAFARLSANAYPGSNLHTAEQYDQFAARLRGSRDGLAHLFGAYRDGDLVGGMEFFDFTMNMRGTLIPVGGVGGVAVDLAHKKQHVAKEMISFFLRSYRAKGVPLVALYPFRPDFYRRMGFGYGAPSYSYSLAPLALPDGGDRAKVRFLHSEDRAALAQCYERYVAQTHGMIRKREVELRHLFETPELRLVGFWNGDQLDGYLIFAFKRGETFLINDIEIRELVTTNTEALRGLLAFLRTQADQIRAVQLHTQDPYLLYLLDDPRDGSDRLFPPVNHASATVGVGLMYRSIDLSRLFALLPAGSFGAGELTLAIELEDDFLPEQHGRIVVRFADGAATLLPDQPADATLQCGVAAFSSLIVGAVPLEALVAQGLAAFSAPERLAQAGAIFRTPLPPMCLTRF